MEVMVMKFSFRSYLPKKTSSPLLKIPPLWLGGERIFCLGIAKNEWNLSFAGGRIRRQPIINLNRIAESDPD
jgi:hypothetical protein